MSDKISVAGLDKAEVLVALHNVASFADPNQMRQYPTPMTTDRAREIIGKRGANFTDPALLEGRIIGTDLSGDEIHPRFFDWVNGVGAAARAIERLRTAGVVESGSRK